VDSGMSEAVPSIDVGASEDLPKPRPAEWARGGGGRSALYVI
jgi:hypothetical protein